MRIIAVLFMVITNTFIIAQTFQITFTGSGLTTAVDTVEVQNLQQNTTVKLAGTDILELVVTMGVQNFAGSNGEITIWPNPTQSSCRIEFYNHLSGSVEFELYDAAGKLIKSEDYYLSAGQHSYNLGGLNSGVFFLKLKSSHGSFSRRIVSTGRGERSPYLSYLGMIGKANHQARQSAVSSIIQMQFNAGERLLFKGISGNYSRVVTLIPTHNQSVDFEFIACTDGDGNHYPVVTIGNQTWMAENLKTTRYNNSTAIPQVNDSTWGNNSTPAYCWHNNDSSTYSSIYGALYNWFALESGHLCPLGWYVPSDAAWIFLTDYLGVLSVMVGSKLKSTGTIEGGTGLWYYSPTFATNESGFTALPGGWRSNPGFDLIGSYGYWWSSTMSSMENAWYRQLSYSHGGIHRGYAIKKLGFSVRCILDN